MRKVPRSTLLKGTRLVKSAARERLTGVINCQSGLNQRIKMILTMTMTRKTRNQHANPEEIEIEKKEETEKEEIRVENLKMMTTMTMICS